MGLRLYGKTSGYLDVEAPDVADNGKLVLGQPGLEWLTTLPAFPAGASVSFNNVFTAEYDDYLLLFHDLLTSTAQTCFMRLRAAGVDLTTGYVNRNVQSDPALSGGSSVATHLAAMTWGTTAGGGALTLLGPKKTGRTFALGQFIMPDSWGVATQSGHTGPDSCDGFSLIAGAGTITGGPTQVYGYRKA